MKLNGNKNGQRAAKLLQRHTVTPSNLAPPAEGTLLRWRCRVFGEDDRFVEARLWFEARAQAEALFSKYARHQIAVTRAKEVA